MSRIVNFGSGMIALAAAGLASAILAFGENAQTRTASAPPVCCVYLIY